MADAAQPRIITRQIVPESWREQSCEGSAGSTREPSQQPGLESVEVILAPRKARLDKKVLDGIASNHRDVQQVSGREIWLEELRELSPAPSWKRVLLSAVCVLPTLWLTELLIALPGWQLPTLGHQLVSVGRADQFHSLAMSPGASQPSAVTISVSSS